MQRTLLDIRIISVLEIIWGSFLFIVSIIFIWSGLFNPSGKSGLGLGFGQICILPGLAFLTIGWLTYKPHRCSRLLNIALFSLSGVLLIIIPDNSGLNLPLFPIWAPIVIMPPTIGLVMKILFSLFWICYFMHPKVKEQFK